MTKRIAVPGVLILHIGLLSIPLSVPVHAQSLSTIHTFTVNAAGETLEPVFLFRGNDGSIYGPALTAPGPNGVLLKINTDGSFTSINANGCAPEVQASDGNFYGRTTKSLCQLTPDGNSANVSAFSQGLESALLIAPNTVAAPIIGNDGSLYGVVDGTYTSSSPVTGPITAIYKLTLGGALTQVGLGGATIDAALIQGRDGNFYGTTPANFITDQGTVYKLTPSGAPTVLHKFSGADGVWPYSLIYAADGALYGVTASGGTSNWGTFFKIDASGAFSLLYNFQFGTVSSLLGNNLTFLQASDGNFYGASSTGGTNGVIDIFQLSATGAFKIVGTLDPDTTVVGIVNGPDGNIYGVSQVLHPTTTLGALFKVSLGGSSSGPGSSAPSASTVIGASSFGGFSSVAPGTWVELYGANLASGARSWTAGDFNGNQAPTSLDKTSVTVGGQPAFIDYISPTQVNALLSSNTPTGSQQVVVTTPTGATAQYTVNVNAVEPGLLAPSLFKIGAVQYAVALLPDGTYALPANAIANVNSRPAKPGDTITVFGIGFGPVTPLTPAGELVQQANTLALPFQVSIGGVPAAVVYDGLAPQFTGLYQFNLTVPQIPAGDAALTFTLNGVPGNQQLFIGVGN